MKRVLVLAAVAMFALVACGGTDRPEGAVERWLVTLNQGKAGEPHKYAAPSVTNQVLPGWASCDTGSLDVIEVGAHGAGPDAQTLVPYRIAYVDDLSSCATTAKPTAPLEGLAVTTMAKGEWRVTELQPQSVAPALKVPSEGGEAIGSAPPSAWLIALGISALLMLLVALLIRLTPTPAPLPKEEPVP